MNSSQKGNSLKKWAAGLFVLLFLFVVSILTTVDVTRSSKLPPDHRMARYLLFPGNAETDVTLRCGL